MRNTNTNLEKKIISIILILSALLGLFIFNNVNANEDDHARFLAHFPLDKTQVIGCYNEKTLEARVTTKCTKPGDLNIMLPPRSQIKVWLKYFNEFEIINRLAIVNFESGFNENAGNKYAKGYVQTLRKYYISPDIDSQLKWLYDRQQVQKLRYTKSGSKRCGIYWNTPNKVDGFKAGEYGVLSCLYRYHYHAYRGTWYAKRGVKATKFYKEYMFGIKE